MDNDDVKMDNDDVKEKGAKVKESTGPRSEAQNIGAFTPVSLCDNHLMDIPGIISVFLVHHGLPIGTQHPIAQATGLGSSCTSHSSLIPPNRVLFIVPRHAGIPLHPPPSTCQGPRSSSGDHAEEPIFHCFPHPALPRHTSLPSAFDIPG